MNRRMTADHIQPNGPSTLANTRPLCSSCNWKRGHAQFTDVEVLRYMTWWYTTNYAPRFLWWLNTSPGEGGRLHRTAGTESTDRRLDGNS